MMNRPPPLAVVAIVVTRRQLAGTRFVSIVMVLAITLMIAQSSHIVISAKVDNTLLDPARFRDTGQSLRMHPPLWNLQCQKTVKNPTAGNPENDSPPPPPFCPVVVDPEMVLAENSEQAQIAEEIESDQVTEVENKQLMWITLRCES